MTRILTTIFLFFFAVGFSFELTAQDEFTESSSGLEKDFLVFPIADGNSASSIIRFSVSGGFSYRTITNSEEDPDLKDLVDDLKTGYYIQTDIAYMLSDYFSIGLKYNLHLSNAELSEILVDDGNGNITSTNLKSDMNIGFAGVVLNGRIFSENRKHILNAGISIGQINYTEETTLSDAVTIKGNTIGMLYNVGYEHGVSEQFGIGVNVNYGIGSITTIEQDGVEFDFPEGSGIGTGRLDAGVILILHF